jgi:hypothetical protein
MLGYKRVLSPALLLFRLAGQSERAEEKEHWDKHYSELTGRNMSIGNGHDFYL